MFVEIYINCINTNALFKKGNYFLLLSVTIRANYFKFVFRNTKTKTFIY